MREFTDDEKMDILDLAMSSKKGREILKRAIAESSVSELSGPCMRFIDGDISSVEGLSDEIEDNVLEAVSEGRWSASDADMVLNPEKRLSKEDVMSLRVKSKEME